VKREKNCTRKAKVVFLLAKHKGGKLQLEFSGEATGHIDF
jgi:hypothetical protein